jgi:hypothetical protein
MFRRMPTNVIDCHPALYRFLVRHPEVVVTIWQLMGITKVTAERTGPYTLACSDGVGTITDLELVYGNKDTHLVYCEGVYDGPLFRKPVAGRCVLLLKSSYGGTPEGRSHITNRLDVFLQIDHVGVDVFTKTLHPLLGRSADINFVESMTFLQRISRAAEQNGPGMQQLAARLAGIDSGVRDEFAGLTAEAHERSLVQSHTAETSGNPHTANRLEGS